MGWEVGRGERVRVDGVEGRMGGRRVDGVTVGFGTTGGVRGRGVTIAS
jgi:hypothetical protein